MIRAAMWFSGVMGAGLLAGIAVDMILNPTVYPWLARSRSRIDMPVPPIAVSQPTAVPIIAKAGESFPLIDHGGGNVLEARLEGSPRSQDRPESDSSAVPTRPEEPATTSSDGWKRQFESRARALIVRAREQWDDRYYEEPYRAGRNVLEVLEKGLPADHSDVLAAIQRLERAEKIIPTPTAPPTIIPPKPNSKPTTPVAPMSQRMVEVSVRNNCPGALKVSFSGGPSHIFGKESDYRNRIKLPSGRYFVTAQAWDFITVDGGGFPLTKPNGSMLLFREIDVDQACTLSFEIKGQPGVIRELVMYGP